MIVDVNNLTNIIPSRIFTGWVVFILTCAMPMYSFSDTKAKGTPKVTETFITKDNNPKAEFRNAFYIFKMKSKHLQMNHHEYQRAMKSTVNLSKRKKFTSQYLKIKQKFLEEINDELKFINARTQKTIKKIKLDSVTARNKHIKIIKQCNLAKKQQSEILVKIRIAGTGLKKTSVQKPKIANKEYARELAKQKGLSMKILAYRQIINNIKINENNMTTWMEYFIALLERFKQNQKRIQNEINSTKACIKKIQNGYVLKNITDSEFLKELTCIFDIDKKSQTFYDVPLFYDKNDAFKHYIKNLNTFIEKSKQREKVFLINFKKEKKTKNKHALIIKNIKEKQKDIDKIIKVNVTHLDYIKKEMKQLNSDISTCMKQAELATKDISKIVKEIRHIQMTLVCIKADEPKNETEKWAEWFHYSIKLKRDFKMVRARLKYSAKAFLNYKTSEENLKRSMMNLAELSMLIVELQEKLKVYKEIIQDYKDAMGNGVIRNWNNTAFYNVNDLSLSGKSFGSILKELSTLSSPYKEFPSSTTTVRVNNLLSNLKIRYFDAVKFQKQLHKRYGEDN